MGFRYPMIEYPTGILNAGTQRQFLQDYGDMLSHVLDNGRLASQVQDVYDCLSVNEESIAQMRRYDTLHMLADAENTAVAAWFPASPFYDGAVANVSARHAAEYESTQYLLNIQKLLMSQYGICVSVDQLLAFDTLPSLLQPESDTYLGIESKGGEFEQCFDSQRCGELKMEASIGFQNMAAEQPRAWPGHCLSLDARMRVADGDGRIGFDATGMAQEVTSPGSAASTSVVTCSENSEKSLPAEHIVSTIDFPKVRDCKCRAGRYSAGTVAVGNRTGETMEMTKQLAQRRKLQGIRLEQLLQADKFQNPSAVLPFVASPGNMHSPCLSSLLQRPEVEELSAPKDHTCIQHNVDGFQSSTLKLEDSPRGAETVSRRLPHPKRPAATSIEPQSVAPRHRRKKIRDKTLSLAKIIPGGTRHDTAAMLGLAIKYVHFLQVQMIFLEKELSLGCHRSSNHNDNAEAIRRGVLHRLLSSHDVQHFLAKEGLCLATQSLAQSLDFFAKSISASNVSSPSPGGHLSGSLH
ncbi:hypothetical protein KP509_20G077700 [Ceratopteris richardii]|uniref:BHLH domain-containing protein n=1 Tax=Ceratopteris richardii TaxID=49495 RepID=A0A8T2SJP2_CERRI|nr:hypothetical protein KP509_20G077700 [Ceratopteris richardii]